MNWLIPHLSFVYIRTDSVSRPVVHFFRSPHNVWMLRYLIPHIGGAAFLDADNVEVRQTSDACRNLGIEQKALVLVPRKKSLGYDIKRLQENRKIYVFI